MSLFLPASSAQSVIMNPTCEVSLTLLRMLRFANECQPAFPLDAEPHRRQGRILTLACAMLLSWPLVREHHCSWFAYAGTRTSLGSPRNHASCIGSRAHGEKRGQLSYERWPRVWDVHGWYGTQMEAEPPTDEDEFMNYGLFTDPLEPCAAEHYQSHMANMYAVLAKGTQFAGRRVLEVGSGRGGGAALLSRHRHPALYIGMDIVASQVASANYRLANLGSRPLLFIVGDAMAIPLPDNSFDVVINVESSHAYSDFRGFLTEVRRVLVDNGTFLIEDFRDDDLAMEEMSGCLKDVFGDDISATNVTSNVKASMDMRWDYIEQRVARCQEFASADDCQAYWWGGAMGTTMMFKIQLHPSPKQKRKRKHN
eukprot:TRINITY_DN90294_c0_g1_i1.p1 TRINITY_DN90294_c0_g1~~TRINITY_DN90294_c0_g1_i1.p1  ORF type:complete len:368 (-),score=44.47 TRINITY_DN90294_c0_g1_i1:64-1167(-)